jgi:hypothetical protein
VAFCSPGAVRFDQCSGASEQQVAAYSGVEVVTEGLQVDAAAVQVDQELGEAVQGRADLDHLADDQGASGCGGGDGAVQLGPGVFDGSLVVVEDGGAAGVGQGGQQGRRVLAGRGAGVADERGHGTPMTRDSGREQQRNGQWR